MSWHVISGVGQYLEAVSTVWLELITLLVILGFVIGCIRYFEKPKTTLEQIHETFQNNRQQVMRLVPRSRTRSRDTITGEHRVPGRSRAV